MKRNKLLRDTLILTLSSLAIRSIGLLFSSYTAIRLGAEGTGLLQLVLSVCAFSVSLAGSGIKLSSIRLTVDAEAKGKSAAHAIRLCFFYAVFPGFIASLSLFAASPFIASLIGHPETAVLMRLFAFSLPFISISCVFSGFFTASRHADIYSGVQTAEQLTSILLAMLFLMLFSPKTPVGCCFAIISAQVFADVSSTFISFLLYLRYRKSGGEGKSKMRELLKIALPDSVSSCLRSALVTVRELLVPRTLRQSGQSASQSLGIYGVLQGMALPVVYFGSCISVSYAALIIPEIADFKAKNDKKRAEACASNALRFTFIYALCICAAVYLLAPQIGALLYPGTNAAFYIRLMAPIIPISYLDTTTDAILKGLGLQLSSMFFNIVEAVICLFMVLVCVPVFGIWGYILMIFTGEILNFAMSIGKLSSVLSPAPRRRNKEHYHREYFKPSDKHIEA